jgi:uncharacterized protein (DUF302 family)
MMSATSVSYGLQIGVRLPYERAVEVVKEELGKEGFGVLTEIDVAATLKRRLNVDFRPYVILGACNPPLAHRALTAELEIGLLLPCNVIVYAAEQPDTSVVSALDPVEALRMSGNPAVVPLAAEVRGRIERVLEAVRRRGEGAES